MCLILFAWKVHPDYPLVVAANRDEFYARPTASAAFWSDHSEVLAGRDLAAGGTWLGMTRSGRIAALTNYRDPAQADSSRPSRGQLVADFLSGAEAPSAYLGSTREYGARCNGYNLLVGDITAGELYWASNITGDMRKLAPGVYGVSNHLLDTDWPKVGAGKTALSAALDPVPDETALWHLLVDPATHADEHLPATGIPIEWERALSAAFIRTPAYGTRASTIVKVQATSKADAAGPTFCGTFDEQTWFAGGGFGERRRFRFAIRDGARADTGKSGD